MFSDRDHPKMPWPSRVVPLFDQEVRPNRKGSVENGTRRVVAEGTIAFHIEKPAGFQFKASAASR